MTALVWVLTLKSRPLGALPSAVSTTNSVCGSSKSIPTSGATPAGPAGIEIVRVSAPAGLKTQIVPVVAPSMSDAV